MLKTNRNRFNRLYGNILYSQHVQSGGSFSDFGGKAYPHGYNQTGGGIGGIVASGAKFLLPFAKRGLVAGAKAAVPVVGGAALSLLKGKGKKKTLAAAKKK